MAAVRRTWGRESAVSSADSPASRRGAMPQRVAAPMRRVSGENARTLASQHRPVTPAMNRPDADSGTSTGSRAVSGWLVGVKVATNASDGAPSSQDIAKAAPRTTAVIGAMRSAASALPLTRCHGTVAARRNPSPYRRLPSCRISLRNCDSAFNPAASIAQNSAKASVSAPNGCEAARIATGRVARRQGVRPCLRRDSRCTYVR